MVVPFAPHTAWDMDPPDRTRVNSSEGVGRGLVEANKLNPLTVRELIDLLATLLYTM